MIGHQQPNGGRIGNLRPGFGGYFSGKFDLPGEDHLPGALPRSGKPARDQGLIEPHGLSPQRCRVRQAKRLFHRRGDLTGGEARLLILFRRAIMIDEHIRQHQRAHL